MKKWILLLAILFIASFLLIGYSIPRQLFINRILDVKSNGNATSRVLTNTKHIEGWWPDSVHLSKSKNRTSFFYKGFSFLFKRINDNNISAQIVKQGDTLNGNIRINKLATGGNAINWSCNQPTKNNLLTNILYYRRAQKISKAIDGLLQAIKEYSEDTTRLYGYVIKLEKLTNEIITVCKQTVPTADQYHQIELNFKTTIAYILKQNLKVTGNYMVAIHTLNNDSVNIMTGIPTQTYGPEEGNINYMQMPPEGHMVTVMYKGLYKHRDSVYIAMEQFIGDNDLSKISLPFERLINNHLPKSDTAFVELKLFYPVF